MRLHISFLHLLKMGVNLMICDRTYFKTVLITDKPLRCSKFDVILRVMAPVGH